ncbi:LysR family transcriptional regulator, partial [Pseudomonas syringae pv. actinidiae]|nr:LysR family transcriptional regulator [Pseudomonas syringae pv. actinidiae]
FNRNHLTIDAARMAYREGALSTPARRAVHDWLVSEALG